VIQVTDEEFEQYIDLALASLPGEHVKNIQNIAITWAEEPSDEQRIKLELRVHETLLGLYEGVPLAQRQGIAPILPDKITLFRGPLCAQAADTQQLQEEIRHTLWHEIGHYYGLDHKRIAELEQ
jgi:predicted Zn-dependent protease with MMP-like domain